MDDLERINKLQGLGLTENQAKAYVALLQVGRASASGLSKASGIPRNKVYTVVEELGEKGLVNVLLDDPITLEPCPIAGFLDQLVSQLDDRRAVLEQQKTALVEHFRMQKPAPDSDMQVGEFRLFRGRRAVLHQHRRMSHGSRRLVRVLCSVHSAARTIIAGGLDEYRETEGGGKVRCEVLTPLTSDNVDAVDRLYEILGDAVRVCADMPDNVVIKMIDDQQVMFTHFVPDSRSLTSGDDIGVWTDNPVFLALAAGMFRLAATGSRSVPVARAAMQRAEVPPRFETIQDAKRLRDIVMHGLHRAGDVAVMVPAEDVRLMMASITDDERRDIQVPERRMRLLTDLGAHEVAALPWGPHTEVRRLPELPGSLAILDKQVLRAYDLDDTRAAFFAGVGCLVTVTDLHGAVAEARDHFERLWADASPVPLGDPDDAVASGLVSQ